MTRFNLSALAAVIFWLFSTGTRSDLPFYIEQTERGQVINKERYAEFIKQHPYMHSLPDAPLSKGPQAAPDKAWEQDFIATMDPALGRPTPEVLWPLLDQWQQQRRSPATAAPGQTGNPWIERGPNNVGGRTRALMWDPTDATEKKVWAGGVTGGLWYNTDITSASSTWQRVDDFWESISVTCLTYDPLAPGVFYAGTGEGWSAGAGIGAGIWKSTDSGKTWNRLPSTSSNFLYVNDIVVREEGSISAIYAACDRISYRGSFQGQQGLYRSTNGGTTWTEVLGNVPSTTQKFSVADIEISQMSNRLWVGTRRNANGNGGGAIYTSIDGTSWTQSYQKSGARRVEVACAASDSNYIYALIESGSALDEVVRTTNSGTSWVSSSSSSSLSEPSDADTGIPSTDFTRGQAWYDLILAVDPNDKNALIAGGIDLFRSGNSGQTWTQISKWSNNNNLASLTCPLVHADQHQILFKPNSSSTVIFGNDGGVFYSSNIASAATSSTAISDRNNGYNVTQYYSGDFQYSAGSNILLAGAQDNGTQRYSTSGMNATTRVIGGDGAYTHFDRLNGNIALGAYVYNSIYLSINAGLSFTRIHNESGKGLFINPSGYDYNLKILYACYDDGKLNRLTGISGSPSSTIITFNASATKATAITVSPYATSSSTLFVGTSNGEIYKVTTANTTPSATRIDGTTMPSGTVSSIALGANENEILATFSNYGTSSVWYTANGGTSWSNKDNSSLPNMPVRSAIFNDNNRNQVMLATELGVWMCDNFMSASPTWTSSNIGLANVRVDQLRFRPADSTVLAVTHGRGLFTGSFSTTSAGTPPTVGFAASSRTICAGQSILFTDTSLNSPTIWAWTFSGGSPSSSSSQNPVVNYTTAGTFAVTLTATNAAGSDTETRTGYITVNPVPNAALSSFTPVCTNTPTFNLSGGSPSGGTYKINGIASTGFNAASIGTGTHTIRYVIYQGACGDSTSQTIIVNAAPSVSMSGFSAVCENTASFALTGGSPTGGTYSGNGVSGNTFNPSGAGVGSHAISYKLTNMSGCADSTSQNISVNAKPIVTFVGPGNLCLSQSAVPLTGGSPAGGAYSGPGVLGGNFDPAIAGVGTHTLKYLVTNANGCMDSATATVVVNSGTPVTLDTLADVCENADTLTLTGGAPSGGTWSGPGVTGNVFVPALAGSGTHNISYSVPVSCGSGVATRPIVVLSPPVLSNSSDTSICMGDTVNLKVAGAVAYAWSPATGLSANFGSSVSAFPNVTTRYKIEGTGSNNCRDSSFVTIKVNQPPAVSAGLNDSACAGGVYVLNGSGAVSYKWSPTGGLSNPNIANPSFTVLTNRTYYVSGSDSIGCTARDTVAITALGNPVVTVSAIKGFCDQDDPYTLVEGVPLGGVWTGPGIQSGTVFNPSLAGTGSHKLTYQFTDSLGCSDTASGAVAVNSAPVVTVSGFPITRCSGDGAITLSGSPGGGTWSGTGISGNNFDPAGLSTGIYAATYSLTDINGCTGKATGEVSVNATDKVDSISGLKTVTELASLNYSVKPVNGAAYIWKVEGGNRIGGASNLATVKWGRGPLGYLTVYQTNQHGCEDSIRTTVFINAVGLEEKIAAGSIGGYPNPASENFIITLDMPYPMLSVSIFDISGAFLIKQVFQHSQQLVLKVDNLSSGVYMVQISNDTHGVGLLRMQVVR
jgi:PKD repeat protein